jgi:hypothetical protein
VVDDGTSYVRGGSREIALIFEFPLFFSRVKEYFKPPFHSASPAGV